MKVAADSVNDVPFQRQGGVVDPAAGPVRHAEKRRTSTCSFADRLARFCVDHYRDHVPLSFREEQKQTCLAAIVAFVKDEEKETSPKNDPRGAEGSISTRSYMLGMGVGTKFLSKEVLQEDLDLETASNDDKAASAYGRRVRDCHAEVLARRAFRRQLTRCMLQDLDYGSPKASDQEVPPILERVPQENGLFTYRLRPGVTLHMYTSSAPCGNATLKKFATMKKECFRGDLSNDEWPSEAHQPIMGHSIPLGQFALLVKKDPGASNVLFSPPPKPNDQCTEIDGTTSSAATTTAKKPREYPARESTDWCPPGTSTVWSGQGSLHTCSDKICRWNYLGLQGSLLASVLERPLYMSSLTVGRKLTECICRRAVCCRAAASKSKKKKKKQRAKTDDMGASGSGYEINHPAIMGTAVYMDDSGVIEESQGVRFHSTLSWAWWPSIGVDQEAHAEPSEMMAECIDGATGFVAVAFDSKSRQQSTSGDVCESIVSRISTAALFNLHRQVAALIIREASKCPLIMEASKKSTEDINKNGLDGLRPVTLGGLRGYKRQYSPAYETEKLQLLSKHPLFRQWKRRDTQGYNKEH